MPESINPLRYPGAKRSLTNYVDNLIDNLIEANNLQGCRFYEPYAGSAAIGLELLQREIIETLVLCEKDVLIYALWSCVFNQTDDLCARIRNTPITIETWLQMQPFRGVTRVDEYPLLDLGFAGLFFNRTNFSGILKANPIGGINQSSQYATPPIMIKGQKFIAIIIAIKITFICAIMLVRFTTWIGSLVTTTHHSSVHYMVVQAYNTVRFFLIIHVPAEFERKVKNYLYPICRYRHSPLQMWKHSDM